MAAARTSAPLDNDTSSGQLVQQQVLAIAGTAGRTRRAKAGPLSVRREQRLRCLGLKWRGDHKTDKIAVRAGLNEEWQ
jgi:hypothetical protein